MKLHNDCTVAELIGAFNKTHLALRYRRRKSRAELTMGRGCLNAFACLHANRPARSIVRLDAERFRRDRLREPVSVGELPWSAYKANTAIRLLKACWTWAIASE